MEVDVRSRSFGREGGGTEVGTSLTAILDVEVVDVDDGEEEEAGVGITIVVADGMFGGVAEVGVTMVVGVVDAGVAIIPG